MAARQNSYTIYSRKLRYAIVYSIGEKVALRAAFGPSLVPLARVNDAVFVVTADLGSSVNIAAFREEFPDRYVNCGVAEANMIGIAAGLAAEGYVPFAVTFASFLGRAIDHIRQSVGHNKLNVKVVGSHGGISNAMDGPSAHAVEDIGIMRSMPGFAVVAPSCPNQLVAAVVAVAERQTPVYLRLYREPLPVFTDGSERFEIGRAIKRTDGRDVTLLSYGPHVGLCLDWIRSSPFSVELIEVHTIEPIDASTILESATKTGRVVTIEDHFARGGLGSAVAELLATSRVCVELKSLALSGYARSGPYAELLEAVGLGRQALLDTVEEVAKARP